LINKKLIAMEDSKEPKKTIVELVEKGPVKISGDFTIAGYENIKGDVEFCRCGGTKSPPFCDGTHLSNT